MTTERRKIKFPPKLTSDLNRRCWDHHIEAFRALVDAAAVDCPGMMLGDQERYSGFYHAGEIVVYIDPQKSRILFGFFSDYIRHAQTHITTQPTGTIKWNVSKGGLLSFSIEDEGDALARRVADISCLLIESYGNCQ